MSLKSLCQLVSKEFVQCHVEGPTAGLTSMFMLFAVDKVFSPFPNNQHVGLSKRNSEDFLSS